MRTLRQIIKSPSLILGQSFGFVAARLLSQNRARSYGRCGVAVACLFSIVAGMIDRSLASDSENPRVNLQQDVGIDQKLGVQVSRDLKFVDDQGKSVAIRDFMGKRPIVLMLVYYRCPMLCGLELNGLVRTLRALDMHPGDEFDILTVSIDPEEPPALAAEKKKSYLKEYGHESAASGWHFLTGENDAITTLAQTVGFRYAKNPENGQYAHAAGLIVLTPDGQVSRYFYGVDYSPRDLRLALVEASERRIGSLTDQILLFCYMYDASTGKYTLAVMRVLRVAGVSTLAIMACGIGLMLRRERRNPSSSLTRSDLQDH